MARPAPKDWATIVNGSERFPRLLDFASLAPETANKYADDLSTRKPETLAKPRIAETDPVLLAYEEAHRAWSNWRAQIDESMGGAPRFRRITSKSLVTLLRNWAAELLREQIQPGHYLQVVTPMITGSPKFVPEQGFSFPYMFGQWAIEKAAIVIRSSGRVMNDTAAGRDKSHSFVGEVDTRVLDFLRTVPDFDPQKWNAKNVHIVISAAKRIATGGAGFTPPAIKLLAVPLSQQTWLSDV